MTLIGKLLAYLNLVVGLGILTTSVSVYTLRPAWFDPIPEGISPWQTPENFKMMQAEIESLSRTAVAANSNAAGQKKIVEGLEQVRADRQKKYAERLVWARTGNPRDKDQAGFYEPVFNKDTGLLELDTPGTAIKGSDNKPLKGADKLLLNFGNDVATVKTLEEGIVKARKQAADIRAEILRTEERLLKMIGIRENVQSEMFHLETFEVNVYETRETVFRRKKQLDERLKELR